MCSSRNEPGAHDPDVVASLKKLAGKGLISDNQLICSQQIKIEKRQLGRHRQPRWPVARDVSLCNLA